jgi:hypothetical protein
VNESSLAKMSFSPGREESALEMRVNTEMILYNQASLT